MAADGETEHFFSWGIRMSTQILQEKKSFDLHKP